MTHYIAILVPCAMGEWRAVFPDVPGCEATGATIDDAKTSAITVLTQHLQQGRSAAVSPKDLIEIERDREWLEQNGVDLANAVITMVSPAA